jgi:hypothetical protein
MRKVSGHAVAVAEPGAAAVTRCHARLRINTAIEARWQRAEGERRRECCRWSGSSFADLAARAAPDKTSGTQVEKQIWQRGAGRLCAPEHRRLLMGECNLGRLIAEPHLPGLLSWRFSKDGSV